MAHTTDPGPVLLSYNNKDTVTLPPQYLPQSDTLSLEARSWLDSLYGSIYNPSADSSNLASKIHFLSFANSFKKNLYDRQVQLLIESDVEVQKCTITNIDIDIVMPKNINAKSYANRAIIFFNDPRALLGAEVSITAITLAKLSGITVIVPKHSVLDSKPRIEKLNALLAMYKELSEVYEPQKIGFLGEAGGANLCASVIVLAFQYGIRGPAALGMLGIGGLVGDSNWQNFALDVTNLNQLSKMFLPAQLETLNLSSKIMVEDPVLDPIFSNLEIFPESLIIVGTRDINFSASIIYHRELKRAGVKANLHVFDGLPQCAHFYSELQESQEIFTRLSEFFLSRIVTR